MFKHLKRPRSLLVISLAMAACGALILYSTVLAGKPDKPGGGGGKGGNETVENPALAYVSDLSTYGYSRSVYITTADGSAKQKVAGTKPGDKLHVYAPAWSPDGAEIAFLQQIEQVYVDLNLVRPDGSQLTTIYSFNDRGEFDSPVSVPAFGLHWSPDGTQIFFVDNWFGDACVLDLATGHIRQLGFRDCHEFVYAFALGPELDPLTPGFQGLVTYAAFDETGIWDEMDIYVAEVTSEPDGTLVVVPETITALELPGSQNLPAWSPDGLEIAFYDQAYMNNGNKLMVVSVDVVNLVFGTPQQLAALRCHSRPTWSPDCRWIGFTGKSENGSWDVLRIRPDGTDLTNISNAVGQSELDAHWNPAWVNDIDP